MTTSFQIADCPFCVRENADNIKRLGYGASCKPATIDNCPRHQASIDAYLGSWNGGWYPQGSSIQTMVLDGWGGGGGFNAPMTPTTPFWTPGAAATTQPPTTKQRRFMCSHCRALSQPSAAADPNGLVQYCMACGHNTFGKWV